MLKFLIIIGCAFILFKLVTGEKKKKVEKKSRESERLANAGVMIKDPVCGTYVAKDNDIRVKQGDEVIHFCSYECRDKYLKELESGSNS